MAKKLPMKTEPKRASIDRQINRIENNHADLLESLDELNDEVSSIGNQLNVLKKLKTDATKIVMELFTIQLPKSAHNKLMELAKLLDAGSIFRKAEKSCMYKVGRTDFAHAMRAIEQVDVQSTTNEQGTEFRYYKHGCLIASIFIPMHGPNVYHLRRDDVKL